MNELTTDVNLDFTEASSRRKIDDSLSYLNQMVLSCDDSLGITLTNSNTYLPTKSSVFEAKFYKDWYSNNSINKRKIAFIRKYKPSFELSLVGIDTGDSYGD